MQGVCSPLVAEPPEQAAKTPAANKVTPTRANAFLVFLSILPLFSIHYRPFLKSCQ